MRTKKIHKKGALKETIEKLEHELPLFFKDPKVKEHSVKIESASFMGLDEFPVYKSKRSSCEPSYKPISKIYFINE